MALSLWKHSQDQTGETVDRAALRRAPAALAEMEVIPGAAPTLKRGMAATGAALREAIIGEIPAFSASGNPQILPELEKHGAEHVQEIARLFGGGPLSDFEFVRAHAQRRAEQRFPLEATLHAYRCGHRVLSRWTRDAASAFVSDNADRVVSRGRGFCDRVHECDQHDQRGGIRRAHARARRSRRRSPHRAVEYPAQRLRRVGRSCGAPAQARRLSRTAPVLLCRARAIRRSARDGEPGACATHRRSDVGRRRSAAGAWLAGTRNNVVTAVYSDTRRMSGWTAPRAQLAGRVHSALLALGPAVLIGISSDQPATSYIPKALHEATVALDFAGVADRFVSFSALPLRSLLLHRATDFAQSALPAWAAELAGADGKAHGALDPDLACARGCEHQRAAGRACVGRASRTPSTHGCCGYRTSRASTGSAITT